MGAIVAAIFDETRTTTPERSQAMLHHVYRCVEHMAKDPPHDLAWAMTVLGIGDLCRSRPRTGWAHSEAAALEALHQEDMSPENARRAHAMGSTGTGCAASSSSDAARCKGFLAAAPKAKSPVPGQAPQVKGGAGSGATGAAGVSGPRVRACRQRAARRRKATARSSSRGQRHPRGGGWAAIFDVLLPAAEKIIRLAEAFCGDLGIRVMHGGSGARGGLKEAGQAVSAPGMPTRSSPSRSSRSAGPSSSG